MQIMAPKISGLMASRKAPIGQLSLPHEPGAPDSLIGGGSFERAQRVQGRSQESFLLLNFFKESQGRVEFCCIMMMIIACIINDRNWNHGTLSQAPHI